jgi:hypothetical protein
LRHPSVYSCCLATTRRGDATRLVHGSARFGSALLGTARRKHRFVYYCVIAGACFDFTVLTGVNTPHYLSIHPSIHPSNYLPTYLPFCLSTYLPIYLLSTIYSPCGSWPFFQFLNLYTAGIISWMGDQTAARHLPTHRTTQNKRAGTSMPRMGFEPTTSVFERAKAIHVLDCSATAIGKI